MNAHLVLGQGHLRTNHTFQILLHEVQKPKSQVKKLDHSSGYNKANSKTQSRMANRGVDGGGGGGGGGGRRKKEKKKKSQCNRQKIHILRTCPPPPPPPHPLPPTHYHHQNKACTVRGHNGGEKMYEITHTSGRFNFQSTNRRVNFQCTSGRTTRD